MSDPDGADEQIYLTGDIGRLLPDGFLIHLGRADTMIKIRGYRVDLAEVERTLLQHPQVNDAAIAAWPREGESYLAAYVVRRTHSRSTVVELRAFLRETLPNYMMPTTFIFLQSLPRTNGKLDRAAFPPPDHGRPDLGQPYTPPRGDIETLLTQIWEGVLNMRPLGIHDTSLTWVGTRLQRAA